MKPPRKTTTFLIYLFILFLNEQKRGVIELLIRRTDLVLNVIDALSLRVKLYGFDLKIDGTRTEKLRTIGGPSWQGP